MLDTIEITRLEKLYAKKRAKQILKYSLFSILAIAILFVAIFSIFSNTNESTRLAKNEQIQKNIKDLNTEEKQEDEIVLNDEKRQENQKEDESQKEIVEQINKDKQTKLLKEKARAKIKEEALAPTDLSGYFDEVPESVVSKEPLYRTTIEEADDEPAPQKPAISIKSQEIPQNPVTPSYKNAVKIRSVALKPSLESIEDHFKNSKDPKDALALAQSYYAKKDYKNAAKWAFELNNLDKNNAEGWLIFAKSKYNVGNKKDALRVLEAFLSQAGNKEEIQGLITKMQSNTPLSE